MIVGMEEEIAELRGLKCVIEGYKEQIGRQAAFIAQLRGRVASLELILEKCCPIKKDGDDEEGSVRSKEEEC
ncbi:MAG: hypothetical protein VXW71_03265 [Actinomycetota bacterium]|nr:hypothetical protein [Actinomycetota bacterium]